jgi:hypothetical protein
MKVTAQTLLPPDMDADIEKHVGLIPSHMADGLLLYLRFGVAPGHFLQAVLSNDLAEACGRADEVNRRALYNYVFLLHNFAPSTAWGSPAAFNAWLERGRALRAADTRTDADVEDDHRAIAEESHG